MEWEKATVLKPGQTAANMLANGQIIRPTGKEFSIIQTEISIRDNGSTTKQMGMEHTPIPMERNMSENG